MSEREKRETTAADGVERRGNAERKHFEALVDVGGEGTGGFAAESVDVSPEGMRLRTSSLPELGEKLVCRFDGPGVEVVAEGEVAWRNEEAQGGEFGLRFTTLDDAALDAVRAMCKPEASENESQEGVLPVGARVRLHIEGLASPMKARVRESAPQELEVGSNLEFLKIGRPLDLEDAEKGEKRGALVDHVKIEVDPATNVPQLVVTLRYDRPGAVDAKASAKDDAVSMRKSASKRAQGSASARPSARADAAPRTARDGQATEARDGDDGESESVPQNAAAAAASAVMRAGKSAASKALPALAFASSKAKDAMAMMVATVAKKRADRAEAKKSAGPRRMTAPPPGGALKSEGRRLVRDEVEGEDLTPPPPRVNKRAAIVGSALGLVAVLAVFGVSQKLGHSGASAHADASGASTSMPATDVNAMPGASGTPVANVPLFGTTPLSTTEAVPPPSPSVAATAAPDAPPAGDGEDKALVKEWGQGKVLHAKVLRIKMDGQLEGIVGASGAMGFTLSVPNHRALSPSVDLAKKDKRLASVKIVNTSQGAEITVQFKDGVPAYVARVKDDKLEIALSGDSKTVAKKKSKKKSN